MNQQELSTVAGLLRGQRQAGLGTLPGGAPFVSMVAYAAEPDFGGFLLHLSQLAPHTGALLADPRAALLVSEPDDGRADVQTLTRVTLVGSAAPLEPGAQLFHAWRKNEDQHRVGEDFLDLHGALPIDLQNHVGAVRDALLDRPARSSVALAVHVRPLEKSLGLGHGVELGAGDEIVFAAMLFLPARCPRGMGNRRLKPRIEFHQRLD